MEFLVQGTQGGVIAPLYGGFCIGLVLLQKLQLLRGAALNGHSGGEGLQGGTDYNDILDRHFVCKEPVG